MLLFGLLQRLFAIASLAALIGGGWLVWSWTETERNALPTEPEPGNARLYIGLALMAWSFLGRLPVLLFAGRGGGPRHRMEREDGRMIEGKDGSQIRIETFGPPDAPAIVMTHGWGLDSTIWTEAKGQLSERYRVVVWDLPGLGRSSLPADRRLSVERMADDLASVVAASGRRGPVLLIGHSIGGMIVQTLCRDHPEMIGREVAGIVLENTTHTNPVETMALGRLFLPLQKPIIEPLMKLDILLSPVIWLMNWQSYLSGSTQLAFRLIGFGTQPSRRALDHSAFLATRNSPAAQAKGNLAMMNWSVTEALPRIGAPALVFFGGRDLVTKPEAGETIAERLPKARAIMVSDAGHMGPVECAPDYGRAIEAFADEVLLGGAVDADLRQSRAISRRTRPGRSNGPTGEPRPAPREPI